QNYPIVQ
nr:Chain P, MA/CA substrate peptide [Human immunodeficiency virus 1]